MSVGFADNVVHIAPFLRFCCTPLTSGTRKIGPGPVLHRLGPGVYFAEQGMHFLDLFSKRGNVLLCWLRGTD
jgi:hypothetical protein